MTDRGSAAPTIVTFAASSPEVGVTRIIANAAVALCHVDKRVLVIDTGADGELVRAFLDPFLMSVSDPSDLLDTEAARLVTEFIEKPLSLCRYILPVGRGNLDLLGSSRPFSVLRGDDLESVPSGEIRAALRRTRYDVILVGLPAATEAQTNLIAGLTDAVVICFQPQYAPIRDAVKAALSIRDAANWPRRTAAAAVPFDARVLPRASQTIGEIRQAFSRLGTAFAERVVKVPELSPAASALSILLDDPPSAPRTAGPFEAFADLVWFITNGEVRSLPRIPDPVRRRYRRSLTGDARDVDTRAVLAYAPSDRPWADWVGEQLRQLGFSVGSWSTEQDWLDGPERSLLVLIGSSAFAAAPVAAEVTDFLRVASGAETVLLNVEPSRHDAFPTVRAVDLTGPLEADALKRLLAAFGMGDRVAEVAGRESRQRFPGAEATTGEKLFSVPRASTRMVGRDAYLEEIRSALVASETVGVVILAGEAGVGKSAIAQAYAYRFAYDYDVVWWIPAGDEQTVRASLTRLGYVMGVEPSADMVAATFDALRAARPGRTLLVYDAADDVDTLASLLPREGFGHIVITAQPQAAANLPDLWTTRNRRVHVKPLTAAEAVAILRGYAPALPGVEGEKLIETTGRAPLSLHLAGALVRQLAGQTELRAGSSASEAASWAADEIRDRLADAGGASFAAIVGMTLDELDKHPLGRLTHRLAELCCYLDPARVSLSLLRWPAMVEQLADAASIEPRALLDEPFDLDQVIWLGQRLEIFSVFWGADSDLQMHGLVRTMVRKAIPAEEQDRRRDQVRRGLAGFAAGRLQDGQVLAELRHHLVPSGALVSPDWAVRRWVLAQLRWTSDDDDAVVRAQRLAQVETALDAWTAGDAPRESLTIQLATYRADLQRQMGRPRESLAADELLLGVALKDLGARSVRVLTARRGMSGDLRGLGQFAEALVQDRGTWHQFRDLFGEDHPQTLQASHNLANSYFLAGYPERAYFHEQDTLTRREALFGPDDPLTWWSMAAAAGFQRELGRYGEASRRLYAALDRIRKFQSASHPDVLRIKGHLAVAERRLGRYAVARQLNTDAVNGYRHTFGFDHPRTQAGMLSLAMDLFRLAEWEDALELARQCLDLYTAALVEGHPFVEACRANLALVLWSAGRADAALAQAGRAADSLAGRLGEVHPWVLAARLNLAGMSDRGPQHDTLGLCEEFLGAGHPYTRVAAEYLSGGSRPVPHSLLIDIDVPEV
jgi:tetratricopeptide (TPR) repeat protein/Mrp family chromosome partitioning ATPase